MESSPASAEVKGSMQAEDREDRETEKSGEEEVGIRVRQQPEKESMQNRSPKSREQMLVRSVGGGGDSLPAHAVATGSPVEPGCMEGWKVDCRSKRSLSIFTALKTKKRQQEMFLS